MKKTLHRWAAAAIGATAALIVTSCAYDPYYSSAGSSYGYGDGYGYGNSSFSTSVFVSTGDPRWGYDPTCYSYYDYQRRAYYDPYLYGYYPVGYRPPLVYGVPHPHGWRPGSRYCPPPSRVRSTNLSNYRQRDDLYRRSNYSWANQVRQRDSGGPSRDGGVRYGQRNEDRNQSRSDYNRGDYTRGNNGWDSRGRDVRSAPQQQQPVQTYDRSRDRSQRPDFNRPNTRPDFTRPQQQPQQDRSPSRSGGESRQRQQYSPSGFNSPVGMPPQRTQQRQQPQQAPQARAERPVPQPQQQPQQNSRRAEAPNTRAVQPGMGFNPREGRQRDR